MPAAREAAVPSIRAVDAVPGARSLPMAAVDHLAVVVNPVAGGGARALAEGILRRCAGSPVTVEVLVTGAPGDAAAIAAEVAARHAGAGAAGAGTVLVVAGGDGTVAEVAEGLHRRGADPAAAPPLLIAPGGTGNSSFHGMWGGRPWPEPLELLLAGTGVRRHLIDLAVIEGLDRIVLLGAGSGLIAQALVTARGLTELTGPERYQAAVAMTLGELAPYPGRVLVDGRELMAGPTLMVVAGGGRLRGGGFPLLPDSLLDDGLLDVCAVRGDLSAAELSALAGLAATGAHPGHPAVRMGRGSRVRIERLDGRGLVFEHDGELLTGPETVRALRVLPGRLGVVLPDPGPAGGGEKCVA